MIRVFVGDEDAVDAVNASFDGSEAGQRFALAKSGVYEEAGALGLEQRDVARAARRQDGNPQADRASPGKFFDSKIQAAPKQILKMMADRWTPVNKDDAIPTMIYSRGELWKSTISSSLVPGREASAPRFKQQSSANAPRSSKSWK
jgi:hypothetical protein